MMNLGHIAYALGTQIALLDPASGDTNVFDIGNGVVRSLAWHPARNLITFGVQSTFVSDAAVALSVETIGALRLDTAQIMPLVMGDPNNVNVHVASPAWNPDGVHLLYTVKNDGIYLFNTTNGMVTRLNLPMLAFQPTWHPDGQHIAFVGIVNGAKHIMTGVLDAEVMSSGEVKNVTSLISSGNFNHHPVWHPNGKTIGYESLIENNNQWVLNTIEIGKREVVRLTPQDADIQASEVNLSWGMDGNSYIFERQRDGDSQIWLRKLGDGKSVQLTERGGQLPAWTW